LPAAPTAALKAASAAASAAGKAEVPKLIGQLVGNGAAVARKELVKLTGQDFGTKVKRWQAWWDKHHDADRVEWLFEGLSHKEEQVRAAGRARAARHHRRILRLSLRSFAPRTRTRARPLAGLVVRVGPRPQDLTPRC
jgi:hypothetical protein